jgi:hypothetical protein
MEQWSNGALEKNISQCKGVGLARSREARYIRNLYRQSIDLLSSIQQPNFVV